jgi:hypothetical protein
MHPHNHEDVTITDEELQAIFDTSKWLQDFLSRLRMADVTTKYGDCTDDGEAVS